MWFRLDDGFHSHPKVLAAGNAAVGLWVRCATYSAHYMLDGRVPPEVAGRYGKAKEIDALTVTGLWMPNGSGFVIRDFLEHNPSADDIRARRAETSAARRAGGLARAAGARRDEHGRYVPAEGEPW